MLMPSSPRMVPITPILPGASTYSNTSDCPVGAMSSLYPRSDTSRAAWDSPASVHATSVPSATMDTREA